MGGDGTAGAGKDPRMQHHVWGVVVAQVVGQEVIVTTVATVSGLVAGKQSVYRAEARAILFVAEYQEDHVLDVTTDSQSVCKRLNRKSLKGASMDLFDRFTSTKNQIDPCWVNSHLTKNEFETKFSANQEWIRILNAKADDLVGRRAQKERNIPEEIEIKARDAVARQVNTLLASRVEALLGYDLDQGPQVQWLEKPRKQSGPKVTQKKSGKENHKKNRLKW